MYNADCSRCACIHVPGVQPVTKGNLVSIFEKDGCGPRSTGFLLFDLFEIAYISCVRICVYVWGDRYVHGFRFPLFVCFIPSIRAACSFSTTSTSRFLLLQVYNDVSVFLSVNKLERT